MNFIYFQLTKLPATADLVCWSESKSHPYWYINPLKMELLSSQPEVLQIYEFIGPRQTEKVLNLASKNLFVSKVVDRQAKPGSSTVSGIRTSVQSWLDETYYTELVPLITKMSYATGLETVRGTSGDSLQIAGYTFSGHYEAHVDAVSLGGVKGVWVSNLSLISL